MRRHTPLIPDSSIARNQRVWLFYYDQNQPEEATDPSQIIQQARQLPLTAIMLPKGMARAYYPLNQQDIPLIVQLNGQAVVTHNHHRHSPLVCTIPEAIQLGAKAVSYTIYLGGDNESTMIQEFSRLSRQARRAKIKSIAIIQTIDQAGRVDRHSNMLAYAAQMALSLGADYTQLSLASDQEKYSHVTMSAGKAHVITDLGQLPDSTDLIQATQSIVTSGAAGIATDQSLLDQINPQQTTRLKHLVFGYQ